MSNFVFKIITGGITAFLAIYGVLFSYKDKQTNKVTIWGKLAIALLLISGTFNIYLNFSEKKEAELKSKLAERAETDRKIHLDSLQSENMKRLESILSRADKKSKDDSVSFSKSFHRLDTINRGLFSSSNNIETLLNSALPIEFRIDLEVDTRKYKLFKDFWDDLEDYPELVEIKSHDGLSDTDLDGPTIKKIINTNDTSDYKKFLTRTNFTVNIDNSDDKPEFRFSFGLLNTVQDYYFSNGVLDQYNYFGPIIPSLASKRIVQIRQFKDCKLVLEMEFLFPKGRVIPQKEIQPTLTLACGSIKRQIILNPKEFHAIIPTNLGHTFDESKYETVNYAYESRITRSNIH